MINKYLFFALLCVFLGSFVSFTSSALSNTLKVDAVSGSTFDFFCQETIKIQIDYGSDFFSAVESSLLFDNQFINLTHGSISSNFQKGSDYSISNGIYFVEGASDFAYSGDKDVATFNINTLNTNSTSTTLEFVDKNGDPVSYLISNTSDECSIIDNNGIYDTLSSVENVTYNFVAYPCTPDGVSPKLYNYYVDNNSKYYQVTGNNVISQSKVLGTGKFKVLVLDWDDTKTSTSHVPRWFSGNNTSNLANYVNHAGDVDTEYGVYSGSLSITIDNTNAVLGFNQIIDNASLYKYTYTGVNHVGSDLAPNRYTWNSDDRGYWIEFENDSNNLFQIEKPFTVTVNGWDNPHRDGSTGAMVGQSFTLNGSSDPIMTSTYPAHQTQNMNPIINQIKFRVTDTWAGVDTGKVWITIPEILSGGVSLMSGHTYTANDMDFTGYNGSSGIGNAGGYDVTLDLDTTQIPFPADSKIYFTGIVVDLAGYTGYINLNDWYINTRKPCSYFGCNEYLDIYIMTGFYYNSGIPYVFTGGLLVATGTNPNSPYPYLTGLDDNILMCGYPWTGVVVGGNVPVEDSVGNSLTGTTYNLNEVYITGLDFSYDPNTGVITIN